MAKRDFYFRNEISIIMLYPKTKRARRWVAENIQLENWQNPRGIAIEHRYFSNILVGITEAGLGILQVN